MDVRIDALRLSKNGRVIVDIGELVLATGTITALFGPNGAGKTSLIRMLAGLEQPTSGQILVNGLPMNGSPNVALAFQRPVFIRGSVRSNLELGLSLRGMPAEMRDAAIEEAGRAFGIESVLDQSVRTLSGGEAQRANLARALCLRAPLTLLDEPLAALDRIGRAGLLEELPHLLRTFATTTVVVTHDREEAFRLAEHLVVMVDGKVRASGPAGEVYRHPPDRMTAELLGYTVVQLGDTRLAIPPGGAVIGGGQNAPALEVERVIDMGNHRDVVGIMGGTRITARLLPQAEVPVKGSRVRVDIQSSVRLP